MSMSAVALSIRQIAAETRTNRDSLRKVITGAAIESVGTRGGHPVYRLRDVLDVLHAEDRNNPDKLPPTLRKAWYDSEKSRLEYGEQRRDLCRVYAVVDCMNAQGSAVRDQLTSMPARRSHEI